MNFVKFGHPQYLHFLWGVLALILLYIFGFRQKRKASERFSSIRLFNRLTSSVDFKRQKIKALLVILSYTFLAIALARPQFGSRIELVKRQGLDIMVALDISLSMQAEDVNPNRWEKAKSEIRTFIDKLNDDRVGLIVFAGDSFVQCPLTIDYSAAKMLLDVLPSPEYFWEKSLIQPGTDIGGAIRMAIRSFPRREPKAKSQDSRSEHRYKALILVTDGENLSKDPTESAEEAAKEGIRIYAIGVGAPGQRTLIPLHDSTGKLTGYKKDETGEPVLTNLNDALLRKIAVLTKGRYYLASQREQEIDGLYKDISSLERRELEKRQFTGHKEGFQIFVLLALVCLAVELIMGDVKRET